MVFIYNLLSNYHIDIVFRLSILYNCLKLEFHLMTRVISLFT